MDRSCAACGSGFEITDDDLAFYEKVSPVFNGKKELIPPPTLCPDCRLQRRLSWRNDRNLYHRTSDSSGKTLITMYSPKTPVKIYEKDVWWSDSWDAKDFGKDIDFNRSFLAQVRELIEVVPHAHSMVVDDVNSPYVNYAYKNVNCHLCFAGNYLQDSYYCYNAQQSRDCADCLFIYESELCYECVHCEGCYNVRYGLHSNRCRDSWFVEDCSNVSNCCMCFNLHHKEYCILNEQYSREEYLERLKEMKLDTHDGLSRAFAAWRSASVRFPKRPNHNVMSQDCTGEYITQSKNCRECYIMGKECEDCVRVLNGFPGLKDSRDCSYAGEPGVELLYECMASGGTCRNMLFCNLCLLGSSDLFYCHIMFGSRNCFGCSNMQNAQYCILNKQYTKEGYEGLVPRIIQKMKTDGEWGEFFPASLSPFGYNETVAQEYYPLTEQEIRAKGLRWLELSNEASKVEKIIPALQLPEDIHAVPDDILSWAIECDATNKPFRIIRQELDYYRTHHLPIPRIHPDERHRRRMALRNPRTLHDRSCMKCNKTIQTTYSPERPEIVYCEECYLQTVY